MRLIDAELAKKDFRSNFGDVLDAVAAAEIIDRQPAVETILPTREQVEKAWGEWIPVRESEITGFNPKFAGRDPICGYKCSRCKAEAVLDCNDEFVLSNFCPTCGAPMTDEAVDILMKRLEALFDEIKAD